MQVSSELAGPAYRLLLESLPGNYLVLSPQLVVVAANNNFLNKAGLEKATVLGKPLATHYARLQPEAVAAYNQQWQETLAYLQTHRAPHTMAVQRNAFFKETTPEPARYWQPVNTPVFSESGELVYIIHEIKDITAEHLAHENARQSQELFKMLSLATNDAIWDWNLRDNTINWNDGYRTLFGFNDPDPTVNSWYDYIHPDDREQVVAGIHQVINSNHRFWSDEYRFRCADGSYADIMDRGYVLYDTTGKAYRMVGSMQDITLYKKAQQQQKESADFFKFLADTIPAFIWTSEPDGTTDYRNQFYYEYVGIENTREPDFSWINPLHPDDRAESLDKWLKAVESGEPFEVEHRLRAKTGEYRWILSRSRPMRNEQGEIIKWFGASIDIHGHKQYQQQLLDQDARLQRMLDEAPIQLCILKGPLHQITYQNLAFTVAVNNKSFVGQNAREAWPEINSQDFINHIARVYKTGIPFKANDQLGYYADGNGTLKAGYFNLNYQPLRNATGEVEGVLCFSVDVTEQVMARQQAESLARELQLETESFKTLTQAIPQLVWSSLPDGATDFFNANWYQYTGLNEAETLSWGWQDVLHPDDLQRTLNSWKNAIETGQLYEIKYRLRRADGQYRWFLGRGTPMHNAGGNIVKWFGTCTDIHEQKLIQEQLDESSERLRFLAESMPQKVWTARPDGSIDYFNQHWLAYTGLTFDELHNQGWEKIIHPEDVEENIKLWQESVSTGKTFQMEHRFQGADGNYRWHLSRGLPMHNEKGQLVTWVGTNTDIHEQKLARENLQTANAELKRINEDLDRFVYTASHDLKLPIINMGSLFNEIMQSCEFKDPEHEKLVELFQKSLDQIHATISDLSEITKVQKNVNAEKEKVNLPALTQEICLSIQDIIQSSGTRVTSDFAIVPYLEFSKANLRSILYNLISNAIKYRSPHRSPEVLISTSQTTDFYVLTVKDNGLGINLIQHKDKLFQMFKRFHSHVPGTGLGLYMINRIMQNNNGHIEVESNLDTGSTFRIYFRK